jgi:hypothetical protein
MRGYQKMENGRIPKDGEEEDTKRWRMGGYKRCKMGGYHKMKGRIPKDGGGEDSKRSTEMNATREKGTR